MTTQKLKDLHVDYCTQRDRIIAATAPLRAQRQQLAEQIAPIEAKIYDLDQAIKAAEQPALHDLTRAIAALEAAL